MGSFVLRFIYAASATGEFKFTEWMLENSEEIVMRSCRSGTYPTRDLRYLRTVQGYSCTFTRVFYSYLLYIYLYIINNPLNFLAPGRHQTR